MKDTRTKMTVTCEVRIGGGMALTHREASAIETAIRKAVAMDLSHLRLAGCWVHETIRGPDVGQT